MPDENIEVVHSEEGGNGLPTDTPSEQPKTETPAEKVEEPATPAEPEQLFELPDGRKVDAVTLTKEWKENFLPDYTRKSQDLARARETINPLPETKPTNVLADPEYVPQTYAELAEKIQQATLQALEQKEQERIENAKAIEDAVVTQLESVKKIDPSVNENALFLHATKYGFRDLTLAHQNMKDMSSMAKSIQKTTVDNITKRSDPVSISPGATGGRPDPSQFENAREYLRSIKN